MLCFEDRNYADYRLRHLVQESDQFQRSYIENAFIFCWEGKRYMLQHTFCITRTLLHIRNASKSNTGLEHLILVYTGLRKTFVYHRKQVHFKYTIADINYYSNLCQTHKIGKPDNQRMFGPLHMILLLSRPQKDRVKQVRRPISGFRSHSGLSDRECTAICLVKYIVHTTLSSQMHGTRGTLLFDFEFVYKLHRL